MNPLADEFRAAIADLRRDVDELHAWADALTAEVERINETFWGDR